MSFLSTLLALSLLLISSQSLAYPEMIRHGYTSCTACHASPSGGGITTAYGRSISKELLSRWSYEGEEQQLHGAIKDENVRSWIDGSQERGFNVSGNFRYIQTRLETDSFTQGRSFAMQKDLEIAGKYDQFTLVASYGFVHMPNATDELELRRLYALYNINDNLSLRAGRFLPTYGIMTNDHYLSIKQGLGLGQLTERDTVEIHSINEHWSGYLNYSDSPSSNRRLNEEKALSVGANYHLYETSRVGLNYFYGDQLDRKRDITGLNALVGFNKEIYSLMEYDYQVLAPDAGDKIKSHYFFQRLGYEFTRGLHGLAQMDVAQTNLADETTKYYAFGAGLTFYPRPHFEFQFLWSRPKFKGQSFADSAFLIFHYYL